jgi:hypothetical protein
MADSPLAQTLVSLGFVVLWGLVFFIVLRFENKNRTKWRFPGGALSLTTILTIVISWCIWFVTHEVAKAMP